MQQLNFRFSWQYFRQIRKKQGDNIFSWNHLIMLICIIKGSRVFKNTKSSKYLRLRKIKSAKYFYISILYSISFVDLNRKSEQAGLDL